VAKEDAALPGSGVCQLDIHGRSVLAMTLPWAVRKQSVDSDTR
jgi:hypothetical protein